MNIKNQEIAGMYGDYELVFATDEAIDEYFEACLNTIEPAEMYEAWQLHHIAVPDLLEKVFASVRQGRGKAYFLLYHISDEEKEVVGIGGMAPLRETDHKGYDGARAGEIWYMGQSFMKHKRFIVQYGKIIIAKILTHYPMLINLAAAWNYGAFKLVKYLGFTIGKDLIRTGISQSLFKCFYIIKK